MKSKFGTSGGSEVFVLSPTLAVTNPVLVHRFSGNEKIFVKIVSGNYCMYCILVQYNIAVVLVAVLVEEIVVSNCSCVNIS